MTCGLNHTGKTTFWKDLQLQLSPSIVIDNDALRVFGQDHFFDLYEKTKWLKNREPNNMNMKMFFVKNLLEFWLYHSVHCIHTACSIYVNQRKLFFDLAKKQNARTILIYFDIPLEVIKTRIDAASRHKDHSLYKKWFEGNLAWMADVFEYPNPDEADYFLRISDNSQQNKIIEDILKLV